MSGQRERPPRAKATGERETEVSTANTITTLPRVQPTCCSPALAWAWCLELAADALTGDFDAQDCLPAAIEHFLQTEREVCRGIPA